MIPPMEPPCLDRGAELEQEFTWPTHTAEADPMHQNMPDPFDWRAFAIEAQGHHVELDIGRRDAVGYFANRDFRAADDWMIGE